MPTRKPAAAKGSNPSADKPAKVSAAPKPAAPKPAAPKPAAPKSAAPKPGKAVDKVESPSDQTKAVATIKTPAKVAKGKRAAAVPDVVAEQAAAVPAPELPAKPARKGKAPKSTEAASVAAAVVVAVAPPATPAPTLDAKAQAVLDAVHAGQALEFIFENGDANPPRTFEPRMISFDTLSKAWYVWGWDRRYNAERHHRLDLLKEINPVEGIGRAAQGPFKDGTAPNLLGGWLGGEPIPVKALLMKQWIFAVKQAPPAFPEFRIEDVEEGKASVSFTATDLRAIARWCMQFGDGIQVLEPQRLVDRIKQVGIAWGGKPKAEAEPARPAPPPPPPPRPQAPAPPRREAEEKPKGKGPKVEVRTERL